MDTQTASYTLDRGSTYMDKFKQIKTRVKNYVIDPFFVDRAVQIFYIFGISGITIYGIFITLPYIYQDSEFWKNVTQAIGWFLSMQIFVNCACMKFVDSSYIPFKYGAMPDGLEIGQNICDKRNNDQNQNNGKDRSSGKVRKDASAVNMNNKSVMYVATEMPKAANEPPKRTMYPYFSWTPCLRCNRPRPPRCHHCTLCNTCVLKRDHHCFFAGACIGYRNLRHFAVFLFWTVIGTLYALVHYLVYGYHDILPFISYFDFLFPISIVRAMFGYIEAKHSLFIVLCWFIVVYLMWSYWFMKDVYAWIAQGVTSFEVDSKMVVCDTRDIHGKVRAVFGNYWPLNFIIPLHFVFEPIDDPIRWPSYKA